MADRPLLSLTRFHAEGRSGLRIESTWCIRLVTFTEEEVAELADGLMRLFPEHFAEAELTPMRVAKEGL